MPDDMMMIDGEAPMEERGFGSRSTAALILAFVLVATAGVYLNSLSGKFLYDDWFQIERNTTIREWSNAPRLLTQHVWEFIEEQHVNVRGIYYRPFFNIALLINYQLFGLNETGWHIVSLLLHLAATMLVFFLARAWGLSAAVAAAAALLFGVHPVHVEAVAWASALPDLMVSVFVLASILFYEKSEANPIWRVISIALAVLAVGSKETGVMLPLFLAAREYFGRGGSFKLKSTSIRLAPYFAVAALYLIARYLVLGSIFTANPTTQHVTLYQSLISVPPAIIKYVELLVFPGSYSIAYDFNFLTGPDGWRFWLSVLFLAAASAALLLDKTRRGVVYICVALFLIFLLPALNLRSLWPQESLIHDRYVYLSSVGFCLLIPMIVSILTNGTNAVFAGIVAVLAIALGAGTVIQNQNWRDDVAMTENAIRHAPENVFFRLHLGEVLEDEGRYDEAESQFRDTLDFQPDSSLSNLALANYLSRRGRSAEAKPYFDRAIQLGSDHPSTWIARGGIHLAGGELAEAENAFMEAIKRDPRNAAAYMNLGVTYERKGDLVQAEAGLRRAIDLSPKLYEAHAALAIMLVGQNRLDEAVGHINAVRAGDPNNTAILYPLGAVYLKQRQCGPAADALRRSAEAYPDRHRSLLLLGFAYECLGQNDEAAMAFKRVIELAPNEPTTDVARRRLEQLQ